MRKRTSCTCSGNPYFILLCRTITNLGSNFPLSFLSLPSADSIQMIFSRTIRLRNRMMRTMICNRIGFDSPQLRHIHVCLSFVFSSSSSYSSSSQNIRSFRRFRTLPLIQSSSRFIRYMFERTLFYGIIVHKQDFTSRIKSSSL